MRGQALLGGLVIVAAVAAFHRPPSSIGEEAGHRAVCDHGGPGYFCEAVTGLSRSLSAPIVPVASAAMLPPRDVPGATDPRITQATIDETICRPGYAHAARPPYAVTGPLKHRMMAAQHPSAAAADYELDHLIPISLGGAPLDPRDLWLQPRHGAATAGDKNLLAYVLWRLVCEHRVSLATAQQAISRDWVSAYRAYATPENVARYHFRHGETEPEPRREDSPAAPAF